MENQTPDTSNHLNWVEIKNFKSIKDLRLDCKRVNIFIGKPNVGKSNILEGLGLLGAGYNPSEILPNSIRYKQIKDLFYDKNVSLPIEINTNVQFITIHSGASIASKNTITGEITRLANSYSISCYDGKPLSKKANDFLSVKYIQRPIDESGKSPVSGLQPEFIEEINSLNNKLKITKKYDFGNLTVFSSLFPNYLLPPNGLNLYQIVRRNEELWEDFAKLFVDQRLELVLDDEKQEFILQKKQGMFVTQYPFFSIADTFRRYMFYVAAIESNTDSVIIFEEPEVHSFPPYTQELAYRIAYDETNQYFISTHSPYLLKTLIETVEYENINVFVTYYENYDTKTKALSKENFRDILDYSTDVFFNLDRLIPHAPKNTVLS